MKTRGEIEAEICKGINRFEQDYMGRGPNHTHTYLIDDMICVRLQGVMTAAENTSQNHLRLKKDAIC